MYRLLALCCLTACLDRQPAADPAPPDAAADHGADGADASTPDAGPCSLEACADLPEIACQDGGGRDCVRQDDGTCARACPPAPPLRICAPADCGAQPPSPCPADTAAAYECPAEQPGFDCAWQIDCLPVGRPDCSVEACGDVPPGEACGPGTEGRTECRRERGVCTWFLSCEPVGCQAEACGPFDGPEPDCEFVAECVTDPQTGCGWRVTCLADQCTLPWDPGPCKSLQPVWWFNPATGQCEQQNYGGCEGNLNRFLTEQACFEACGVLGGDGG